MFLPAESCIDRYYPEEYIESTSKLVVDGIITDESEMQKIVLSKTSSLEKQEFIPYSYCIVQVSDDKGNSFFFEEQADEPGNYYGQIEEQFLTVGSKFRLEVVTPENKRYLSSYEELLPSPDIDTVYYEIISMPTSDPEVFIDGAQFYLDFFATDEFGKNYLFRLEETYEYHSTWPIRSYFDETGFVSSPADYSKFICYKTDLIPTIFLLTTSNLVENTYIKYELNFVNDHTQQLLHHYTLYIKQYALSESAYNFWKILKENNQDIESLYAKQPQIIIGNIKNADNSGEPALGYFGVSSVVTHRLTIKKSEGLSFNEVPYCTPIWPETGFPPTKPLYLVGMKNPKDPEGPSGWGYADAECFDCTLLGGTVVKPPFFEDE